MKHLRIKMPLLFAGALMIAPVQMSYSQEAPSVEKMAERRSNHLKDALSLSDKQYKKIYDIILAEENARKEYMEKQTASQPKPPVKLETPAEEKAGGPDQLQTTENDGRPEPPAWCPYSSCPRGCVSGDPDCCKPGRGCAPEPPCRKHGKGKGYGPKGNAACPNPGRADMRIGMDSIRSEYNAKIIGVLSAEQTEKYLLISRQGQRPMPSKASGRPVPHHNHGGYGRR